MNKIAIALTTAAALTVTACGPSVKEQCAQAKDPAQCVAVANAGGDVNDYLLYGMAGYMLGSMNGQTTIIRDPSYRGPVRPVPSYARAYEKATVKTTVKSNWGGTKTTTTTTYRSSGFRPSYSSSFRSSGFRGR